MDRLTADSPMENKRTTRSKPKANQNGTNANVHPHVNAHNQVNAPNAYQETPQVNQMTLMNGSCWNLLSAARRPTGVNSGDNRVTCTGAIALLI
jgi:hypothetical protein